MSDDLAALQAENRALRQQWASLRRLVLTEWKRGTKMPYAVVKPFLDEHAPVAVGTGEVIEEEEPEEEA